jgi:hypothetical protein
MRGTPAADSVASGLQTGSGSGCDYCSSFRSSSGSAAAGGSSFDWNSGSGVAADSSFDSVGSAAAPDSGSGSG